MTSLRRASNTVHKTQTTQASDDQASSSAAVAAEGCRVSRGAELDTIKEEEAMMEEDAMEAYGKKSQGPSRWERTVSYLSLDRPLCKDAKGVHPATKENFIVIVLANLTKALVGSLAHSSPVAVAITYAAMDTMKETSGVKRMASNACANGQKTH
ncbi:g7622 [Coccomyxa viridis]|uniref:G7622 protein n=1 Tax=Coccomyxa viridis TaxID=1274662 RepID=A0ABP1G0S7_9CHLO